jgi:hypothetical protein
VRKVAIVVSVVALVTVGAGLSAAYGQSTTPTSFQGGPDVSSDVTAPGQGRVDVPGGTGIAETDDDSSPVGWIVAAVVLVAAVAAIAVVLAKRNRERGYRDVPSGT